jgi:radical SAM protein with 4Fe4S-binding SPASM domain
MLPDTVVEIGKHLKRGGRKVSVITNGTLITEKLAKELASADIEVFVSLTAPSASLHDETVGKKGAYRKAIQGIQHLVDKGVRTGINMVVTQRNKTLIQEMGFLAAKLGVGAFSASRLIPPWDACDGEVRSLLLDRSDVRIMFQDLKSIRQSTNLLIYTQSCYPLCLMADFSAPIHLKYCSIGGPALAIGPRGDIRPCALMPHICGNVLTEGFGPALEKMSVWRAETLSPPECQMCKVFEQCKGGCRITAYYAGNVSGLDMYADPSAIAVALGLNNS